ncbi:hypothetical protein CGK04_23030 [Vibrio parahaemolyticus]|nr:hypothetical protein CGK04_23030 [Vibrio parahaemolyticus]
MHHSQPTSCSVDRKTPRTLQKALAKYQLIYSILGLFIGLCCVIGGIFLFVQGISGEINWSINMLEMDSNLMDAAPGVVLFIVGLLVIVFTRFKFKHI